MGNQIAPSSFATSAQESLAAADAYTVESGDVVVNDRRDVNDVLNVAGLKGLLGGNLSASLKLISMSPKGIQINADALLKGIVQSNSGLNSALSQASAGLRTSITSVSGYSNVTATINGLNSTIRGTNLSDLKAVGSMIGSLTSTPYPITFTDMTGLSNLTTNLISQASQMGMPGAYTAVAAGMNNPGIMSQVTRDLAPIIISRSNTDLMDNVSRTPYRTQLTASRPQFIQEYSQGYQAPPLTSQTSYRPTMNNVGQSYSRIDATWKNSRNLGGPPARTLNLSRAVSVSSDFDRLLQANAGYASVPVPTNNFAAMDTSCKAVQNVPNLPYDMDLAQLVGIKQAMPLDLLAMMGDPVGSLKTTFPLVPIA